MSVAISPSGSLARNAAPYLSFLEQWLAQLTEVTCDPAHSAVVVVDVIEGFCEHGALSSPRVATMVPPVVDLLRRYQDAAGKHVLLPEDAHGEAAREFASFPPHCLAGTDEARTVQAVAALEHPGWRHFPKETTNPLAEPAVYAAVIELLEAGIRDFVVVGDCTDLCIYQCSMGLQILLNKGASAPYRGARVIVPAQAVQTYDISVDAATGGVQPHPGDLLHAVFLHHMAINGVTVGSNVAWVEEQRP